jgi:DmsE family decaheme c-type cytochrome
VKHHNREAVELGLTGTSSGTVPDKPKLRISRTKVVLLGAASVFLGAAFYFSPPAKAETGFTVAGINSTLPAWGQSAASTEEGGQPRVQVADDQAVTSLAAYVQQVGRDAPKAAGGQFDDEAYAALRDFTKRIGAAQPAPLKGEVKVAEAQTLMELLSGKGSSEPTPAAPPPKAAGGKKSAPPVEAHFVGSKACATCHAPLIAQFKKTLMGKISDTPKGRGKFECENCHGPGSAHVKAGGGRGVGGILSFEADDPRPVEDRNAICLTCHQRGERTYWEGSVHQTRGLACTNCHTVMKAVSHKYQLKTVRIKDTCFQCHKLQQAQIQYSSHMPIREDKITCTDCHNPHGSVTEKLIRQASVNENCYTCHAEKRGPFLFEHQPVRENCLNCHVPHGSNYENLLKVARPRLCNECHTTVHSTGLTGGFGRPNTVYTLQNGCGNCHSNIHGSNHPNGFFFLR